MWYWKKCGEATKPLAGSLVIIGGAVDEHHGHYCYCRNPDNHLRRRELVSGFAQQYAAVFQQVVHVLGFTLKHMVGTFKSTGKVFGKNFFDFFELRFNKKGGIEGGRCKKARQSLGSPVRKSRPPGCLFSISPTK